MVNNKIILPCYNLSLTNLDGEIWIDAIGYDGMYSISNYGRVKSERRVNPNGQIIKERILKQTFSIYGEPTVVFSLNGVRKTMRILDLVGSCYLGEKKENEVYCHKNKLKSDNRLVNIVITTKSKSNQLNFTIGVQNDWGIGDFSKKIREKNSDTFDVYENGILKQKKCSRCGLLLDISQFYFRKESLNFRFKCKNCYNKKNETIQST